MIMPAKKDNDFLSNFRIPMYPETYIKSIIVALLMAFGY